MKTIINFKNALILGILFAICAPLTGYAQPTRIKPPKRLSKIESANNFVKKSFELYEKVFVYDSLTQVGVEIPVELEEELAYSVQEDFESLLEIAPEVADDISGNSPLRQPKALLNMNKARRVLTYCGKTIKGYVLGTKEEE